MKKLLTLLALLPALFACKTTHYTPKTYTGQQITAGTSGGVTGMIKEYVIFDNGQLFVSKGLKEEWKALPKLKRSQTREIFSMAEELDLINVKFNHPGNMTFYLILKQPPSTREIKWGETGMAPPDEVKAFYDFLMKLYQH
jgi:hypothetical protein